MEKLIYEYSQSGKEGVALPQGFESSVSPAELIPAELLRQSELQLPEVSEPEVVRHFTNLSTMNHHVDKDLYPLGSCTMKYNPKVNDRSAALSGLANCHPLQDVGTVQGALQIIYELERYLCEITGLQAATLQPAAGSHGELTGVLLMKKYFDQKGENRQFILIPDSAHGTNPASAASANYKTISLKSNQRGCIDLEDLRARMNPSVAGLMLTNPNTLGLFEEEVGEINEIVHNQGGLVYMDGANLNALLGIVRPGDMGFDITHINLHKTFATPHGGGGPGSGAIAVNEKLVEFLPVPRIEKNGDRFSLNYSYPRTIGKVLGFYGNFGVIVRAYCYIRMMGTKGLQAVSRNAILNANYLRQKLSSVFKIPYNRTCMHEFVASGERQFQCSGVKTLDIAKRLLDFGFHSPTVYFPLIVKEALMIEPTETESKETLDRFIETLVKIDQEATNEPEKLRNAPWTTPVRRLDELKANKELNICWGK